MRHVTALATVVVIGLSGCAGPAPTATPSNQAWMSVMGPRDGFPPGAMSLEFDGTAWPIPPRSGGGVVMPYLSERTEVRMYGLTDCHLYASFETGPGSAHLIRFDADGSVSIEDMAGQAQEHGPGLEQGESSGCGG